MGTKENAVQKSCLYMLNSMAGAFAWRNNSGVMRAPGWVNKAGEQSKDRFIRFGGDLPGAPDILAVVPIYVAEDSRTPAFGQFLGVETKSVKGKTSKDREKAQAEWARLCREAGGEYLLVRSTIPLEAWLRERGLMGGIEVPTRATHPELFP